MSEAMDMEEDECIARAIDASLSQHTPNNPSELRASQIHQEELTAADEDLTSALNASVKQAEMEQLKSKDRKNHTET